MEKEEKIAYLKKVYSLAVLKGLCSTRKEFAALVGINDKTLSSAVNGNPKNLTDSLIGRVEVFAMKNNLEVKDKAVLTTMVRPADQKGIFLPEETRAMYENMSETIKIQAQIIAQMQGQLSTSIPFPAKNTYPEKRLDK